MTRKSNQNAFYQSALKIMQDCKITVFNRFFFHSVPIFLNDKTLTRVLFYDKTTLPL